MPVSALQGTEWRAGLRMRAVARRISGATCASAVYRVVEQRGSVERYPRHHLGLIDVLAGDQRPTHRPPPGVPAHYSLPIDFVFIRVPSSLSLQITGDLRFSSKLDLTHKHQDYLSDHNAIEVGFTLNAAGSGEGMVWQNS